MQDIVTPDQLLINQTADDFLNFDKTPSMKSPPSLQKIAMSATPLALNLYTPILRCPNSHMFIGPQAQAPNYDFMTPTVSDINERYHQTQNDLTTRTVDKTGEDTTKDILNSSYDTQSLEMPSLNSSEATSREDSNNNENSDPFKILKSIRISNVNRLTIGQLNINSIRNKFDALKSIVSGNLDILVITESKIDESFPKEQFCMKGFAPPFRLDRTANGGGVLIYVRDDITCKELEKLGGHPPNNLEGIFLELNLKKSKWLLLGGYNPNKENIAYFLNRVGPRIDHYMPRYDNFILLGD